MRAESVNGSTPGARVTWSTTIPPECVTFVTVEFRSQSSRGPVIATYNTTNTSGTEFIQTGLQCATNYYITAILSGKARNSQYRWWSCYCPSEQTSASVCWR